ncbi:LysR substrate-binding domain-containing protein [Vreelandella olivaria]|uniref:LysR substrate-binding domain-containing protein n=1 Tax=Vreelandella olivaria TaxID=390919 RepID=UPI00201F3972|nr:LysR substrate-binding domain-containing protein [Halomonas olivaria]
MTMALASPSSLHFEALIALSEVARHGSLQAAAQANSFSVAKLNRLLCAQEQRLGIKLINTSPRGITLTEAGARLHRYAEALTEAVADAEIQACQEHRKLSGTLRLQTPQALLVPLMLPLVQRLQEEHPGLAVFLLADEHPRLIGATAPAHLRLMPGPLPASSYARHLGELRVGLFASPRYLDKAGRPDSLQSLARHTLIHCPREGQLPVWPLAGGHILRFEPRLSLSTSAAALQAAINGAGIVRSYQLEAAGACAKGLLEPVAEPLWPSAEPLALTYDLGLRAPANVMAFLTLATPWLRAQLAS